MAWPRLVTRRSGFSHRSRSSDLFESALLVQRPTSVGRLGDLPCSRRQRCRAWVTEDGGAGFRPLRRWGHMRPAWTCLIGIVLAVFLNKCTEYFTGTEYAPVKSLAKACQTGHATNIIQGLAVGYESAVAAVIIMAAGMLGRLLISHSTAT